MHIIRKIIAAFCLSAFAVSAPAQNADSAAVETVRPVLSAYGVEAGSAHLADTYLTPLHYNGWHTALTYERMQAMGFAPENWVMQLSARISFDGTQNRARNADMYNLEAEGAWTMMRRWRNPWNLSSLTLAVGPGTSLRGGCLYLSRNGNNPASAKGAWTVNAHAMAAYNLRLGRLPVTLRYEAMLPVTGAFFAPEYGQLYYEIWLGERKGLCQAAWFGNYFRLVNHVTADLRLGSTTLRLGYHNDIISTKVHDIVSRRTTHAFSLAIVTEWISLDRGRRAAADARFISALY